MDTLVFDIETQNFFTDPEVGKNNFQALKISVIGIYSYLEDKYFCFEEPELAKASEIFEKSRLLVGFSINHYDVPVLHSYFQKLSPKINLWEKSRLDIAQEIEFLSGRRISLDKLAKANLGIGKERKSFEATILYKNGRMEELKNYCLRDVELTKKLYDLYLSQKYLLVPSHSTGELFKLNLGDKQLENAKILF